MVRKIRNLKVSKSTDEILGEIYFLIKNSEKLKQYAQKTNSRESLLIAVSYTHLDVYKRQRYVCNSKIFKSKHGRKFIYG